MNILKRIDKNLIGYLAGVGILLLFFIFLVTCTQIGYDVEKRCELAQNKYGGECVEALMKQIADDSNQFGKNDAIWALGQLGDQKALSFLEQYNNGEELPDREAWDQGISQYELRKAIKLLSGGFNLTAFVWR
jgi:hypothetical protein